MTTAWLARRWYYTPKSRRAYSVRQVSPGDRRVLAEFMMALAASEREKVEHGDLATMLFDHVIVNAFGAAAFAALENTVDGDRVIGVCAYAPSGQDGADFAVAVANSHREEQVGRTLMSTLLRHAKRAGVRRLTGVMHWSNRPMQMLGTALGFSLESLHSDRNRRLLVLDIR
jgi:GNAT superfamily N-acetyltransferase